MVQSIRLESDWTLAYFPQHANAVYDPQQLAALDVPRIKAAVPGNVELDLTAAGVLPELFQGNHIHRLREYERHEWWYETEFAAPVTAAGQTVELIFHGVDCLATYWLNGVELGSSDNMLIEHQFEVTGRLLADAPNKLAIRLRSPVLEAIGREYEPSFYALPVNWEQLWVRKAAHGFGWDIMPRAVTAGLWRPVELVVHDEVEIASFYAATISVDAHHTEAVLNVFYQCKADPALFYDGLEIVVRGRCGGSSFEERKPAVFAAGSMKVKVANPELWWPSGYGKPNLYEVTTELVHSGRVLASRQDMIGIRKAELLRTETTTIESGGEFLFHVNGVPVMCKGSNWVPLDAFHSRDAERVGPALELFRETDCNIVRCWGGNVYEDHDFFDRCDRLGLMVWQDFAMGCALYPQTPDFKEVIRKEATAIVRKLRNHPSIVLWCGDNECDEFYVEQGLDPANNKITRELLPEIVHLCDPYRDYLPSSPYLSPQTIARKNIQLAPERHLWGPRDYYKSNFYKTSTSHFASEMGYHGCPNLSSLEKFLDRDKLWPYEGNEQWITHATETIGVDGPYAYRVRLMADQIKEMFGEVPDRLDDFIIASQISQAEAKKFFVEMTRLRKWRRTGVIWWNMLDGWPQFSDAVVDYYFGKKLAYHYIRRAQQPFCIMIDEPENWHVRVVAGNDGCLERKGTYRIWDADSGESLLAGAFHTAANENRELGKIRISHADNKLLLIEWEIDGRKYGNHYLLGFPAFSLAKYKSWLKPIAALMSDFSADRVGK